MRRTWCYVVSLLVLVLAPGVALSGKTDPPGGPDDPASAMPTLEDLYNRLLSGADFTLRTTFVEPTAGPGPTGYSLTEIMDLMPVADNTDGARPGEVVAGKTYWGLRTDGSWGPQAGTLSGTLTPQTIDADTTSHAAGIYEAFDLALVDPELASGNIHRDVTIFGVAGDPNVVGTSSGDAAAGDLLSPRRAWVDGEEVTGTIATQTLSPDHDTIDEGYYEAATLSAVDEHLASGNILRDVTLFGVEGDLNVVNTSSGDAAARDLLADKKAWVDGTEVTGAIATQTLSADHGTVAEGYYEATTLSAVDEHLVSGNIRRDVTLFGVTGEPAVVDTSSGDAVAADLLSGKRAWVDGVEVVGTIETQELSADHDTVAAGYYAATTLPAVDEHLASSNIHRDVTIFGVTGNPYVVNTSSGDAAAGDLLSGKQAWVDGAVIDGMMPDNVAVTIVPTTTAQTIASGYHSGAGKVAGEANLEAVNIKCGVTIFGVTGTLPPGCVAKTGQTFWYLPGDDGDYQKGCLPIVAPYYASLSDGYNRTSFPCSAKFTDNEDGTVIDNLTGLIWLKDASCSELGKEYLGHDGVATWEEALMAVNRLGNGQCGLNDGSVDRDWRLPNINELLSLFDPDLPYPYLPTGLFTGLEYSVWSSTTWDRDIRYAWFLCLDEFDTGVGWAEKDYPNYSWVWPVRGGQ